jgi:hypothetical protein
MAKATWELKKAGKSWSQIQDALERLGFADTDLGTIKRTYKEFRIHLMSKEVWQAVTRELFKN